MNILISGRSSVGSWDERGHGTNTFITCEGGNQVNQVQEKCFQLILPQVWARLKLVSLISPMSSWPDEWHSLFTEMTFIVLKTTSISPECPFHIIYKKRGQHLLSTQNMLERVQGHSFSYLVFPMLWMDRYIDTSENWKTYRAPWERRISLRINEVFTLNL